MGRRKPGFHLHLHCSGEHSPPGVLPKGQQGTASQGAVQSWERSRPDSPLPSAPPPRSSLAPIVTRNGPKGLLPQTPSGPSLGSGARRDPCLCVDWVGVCRPLHPSTSEGRFAKRTVWASHGANTTTQECSPGCRCSISAHWHGPVGASLCTEVPVGRRQGAVLSCIRTFLLSPFSFLWMGLQPLLPASPDLVPGAADFEANWGRALSGCTLPGRGLGQGHALGD